MKFLYSLVLLSALSACADTDNSSSYSKNFLTYNNNPGNYEAGPHNFESLTVAKNDYAVSTNGRTDVKRTDTNSASN